MIAVEGTRPAPFAEAPVRGRVRLPVSPDGRIRIESAAAVLTAAAVTGGTVLVRNWDDMADPDARQVQALVAETGAYVVRSRAGLTVTTRATGGELAALDAALNPRDPLCPFAVVLALRGDGDSRLRGLDPVRARDLVDRMTGFGIAADLSDGVVTVGPGVPAAAGARWPAGSGLSTGLAGLTLGLIVRGTVIEGCDGLDRAVPGFLDVWRALITADEYLLPGSDLLPGDYPCG